MKIRYAQNICRVLTSRDKSFLIIFGTILYFPMGPNIFKQKTCFCDFPFMGHTDYIDSEINGNSTMMMVSENLRVALLTEHIPVAKVTDLITPEQEARSLRAKIWEKP